MLTAFLSSTGDKCPTHIKASFSDKTVCVCQGFKDEVQQLLIHKIIELVATAKDDTLQTP